MARSPEPGKTQTSTKEVPEDVILSSGEAAARDPTNAYALMQRLGMNTRHTAYLDFSTTVSAEYFARPLGALAALLRMTSLLSLR